MRRAPRAALTRAGDSNLLPCVVEGSFSRMGEGQDEGDTMIGEANVCFGGRFKGESAAVAFGAIESPSP